MKSTTLITIGLGVVAVALAVSAAPADAEATQITFNRDVAPIFQRSCQRCHRPEMAAPMSLLTYESARPWAKSIKRQVASRNMPPWHIDRSLGEYEPDPSLSDEEVATIVAWVDDGARRGDSADLPPPVDFPSAIEWEYGEPDLVVTMEEDMVVAPQAADIFPSFVADSGLAEDRYIRWIEVKPSILGRKSVHHIIVYAIQDDVEYVGDDRVEGDDDPTREHSDGLRRGSLLIEYAVGNTGDIYPTDTGKLLMAGAKIRFSSHYHSIGEELRDRTSVGFGFYPKGVVPKHRIISTRLFAGLPGGGGRFNQLSIPPHADNVRHDGYRVLPRPIKLISFQAHMHYRGKAMELEAIHADGRRQPLTNIDRYDFNWQIVYPYKNPPIFPAGTILHVTSYHDNSAGNPHNPDPTAWVGWGSRTIDDMAIGWTNFVYLDDEDYEQYEASAATAASGGR